MINIDTKYNVDDVVYIVQDYRVIKSVIDSIIVQVDKKSTVIRYNTYSYQDKKNPNKKIRAFTEAFMVKTLDEAKQSALANWRRITLQVQHDLETLKESDFKAEKK